MLLIDHKIYQILIHTKPMKMQRCNAYVFRRLDDFPWCSSSFLTPNYELTATAQVLRKKVKYMVCYSCLLLLKVKWSHVCSVNNLNKSLAFACSHLKLDTFQSAFTSLLSSIQSVLRHNPHALAFRRFKSGKKRVHKYKRSDCDDVWHMLPLTKLV